MVASAFGWGCSGDIVNGQNDGNDGERMKRTKKATTTKRRRGEDEDHTSCVQGARGNVAARCTFLVIPHAIAAGGWCSSSTVRVVCRLGVRQPHLLLAIGHLAERDGREAANLLPKVEHNKPAAAGESEWPFDAGSGVNLLMDARNVSAGSIRW